MDDVGRGFPYLKEIKRKFRNILSMCSNKIITFDLSTGDTSRTVYPSMVGLMLELDMCPNNK